MSDWEETSLGELVDIKHGFAFKGQYFKDSPPGDILLTPGNFAIGGGFQFNKLKYYDGPNEPDYTLQGGELLVTMTDLSKAGDTLGYPAIVPVEARTFLHNQRLGKVVMKSSAVDEDFIYWLMRTPAYRNEVLSSYTGSTVKHTSPSRIQAFRFLMPPRSEREAIVASLSALDDKIELNRRMNETLEEMARALFRDWFVDFGPTRRQAVVATDPAAIMGHAFPPEKAANLAPLFPAKLGDDGLPEGWEVRDLRSALTLNYGKSLTKKARKPGPFNVFGSGGISGTHDTALAKGPSIIVGRKGTVGSLYWTREDFYAIDTVFYVTSNYPMVYCHRLLETLGLETMNTDAAVPGLNRDNAYRQEFAFGGEDLIDAYAEFVGTLTEKSDANHQENQTLAEMRDLLLPNLMSGKIRLKDAGTKL